MKSSNSNLILGLAIGAAVGAAVGALVVSARSHDDTLLERLEDWGKVAKKKVSRAVEDSIEELEEASEKISRKAHKLVEKASK